MGTGLNVQNLNPRIDSQNVTTISSGDSVGEGFAELVLRRELLFFLVWRDIKVRYKQTVLGVAWALLVPLFQAIVFTLIFGRLAKINTGSPHPYPVFVMAGLIPWTFFSQAVTQGSQSLINQQHLLTKIYFPRIFVPSAAVLSCFVDFMIGFLLYAIVLAYYRIIPPVSIVTLPILVVLTAVATLGVVYFLSALTVTYRDFRYVVPIAVQILMYASPIVYPVSLFPLRYRWILAINPIAGIIDGYRSAILGQPWDVSVCGVSSLSAVACFFLGMSYFRRTERRFADIV